MLKHTGVANVMIKFIKQNVLRQWLTYSIIISDTCRASNGVLCITSLSESMFVFIQRRRQENSPGGQALAQGPTLSPPLPSPFLPFPFLPSPFPSLPSRLFPSPLEVGP